MCWAVDPSKCLEFDAEAAVHAGFDEVTTPQAYAHRALVVTGLEFTGKSLSIARHRPCHSGGSHRPDGLVKGIKADLTNANPHLVGQDVFGDEKCTHAGEGITHTQHTTVAQHRAGNDGPYMVGRPVQRPRVGVMACDDFERPPTAAQHGSKIHDPVHAMVVHSPCRCGAAFEVSVHRGIKNQDREASIAERIE